MSELHNKGLHLTTRGRDLKERTRGRLFFTEPLFAGQPQFYRRDSTVNE